MMNLNDHTVLGAHLLQETLVLLKQHQHLGYWTLHHLQHLRMEGVLRLQSEITTKSWQLINNNQDVFTDNSKRGSDTQVTLCSKNDFITRMHTDTQKTIFCMMT